MKRIFSTVLIALCAVLAFSSCETLDPDKDFSGTIYGFWVVDKLVVDASVTINGKTTTTSTPTDFSGEYCRLNLDTSHIATLWFNLEWPDTETFTYNESTQRIEFKKGLDKGDNGKALEDVNTIRRRAGIPEMNNYSAFGYKDVLEVVLDERRMELCFEGHRYFDMLRNQLPLDRRYVGYHTWEVIQPTDLRIAMLISQDEINSAGIEQNPR